MTRLFYEPDALIRHESQVEWESDVRGHKLSVEFPSTPGPGASERELRAYFRACLKLTEGSQHQLHRRKMDTGYIEYQRLFAAQQHLREQDYGASIILDAFGRMPKLYSIFTSLGCSPVTRTLYLSNAFKTSLQYAYGDLGHGQPTGVPQLRSLLLGSYHAGRHLTRLIIGDVNWQFLRDEAKSMNLMKQSLRQLRVLDLMISTGYDIDEDEIGSELLECRDYLTNNALCDFIKAASQVESLSIAFDCYTTDCATELKHIVCDHHWPNLKRVEFERIDATPTDFATFFDRHASTLRHLGLRAIRLLEQGRWVSTLENMQKTLSLETAEFGESIYCEDPLQYWLLGARVDEDDDDENAPGNITSAALSSYLVHGGTCPLLDEEKHPNREDLLW